MADFTPNPDEPTPKFVTTKDLVVHVEGLLAAFHKKAACCPPGADLERLYRQALTPATTLGNLAQ